MALERKAGFTSAIATDPADTAAGLLTPDRYNLAHVVSGATVGSIPYFPTATSEASSGMTWNANGTAGEGLELTAGTATTDVKAYSATQTWNNAAVTFTAFKQNVTDTASAAASLLMDLQVGSTSEFKVTKAGHVVGGTAGSASAVAFGINAANTGIYTNYGVAVVSAGTRYAEVSANGITAKNSIAIGWTDDANATVADPAFYKAATNSYRVAASSATTTSATKINKAVASIPDNTATATFTVTVPNAAHSAMLKVTLVGSLGAGGAVGANEATGTISYDFAITRTAGVATVVGASTAYGSTTAAVAGATTITITAAASAMTGAVGATQTFTINVTIAKGGGSSDNHTCLCYGRLLNANASGITIA